MTGRFCRNLIVTAVLTALVFSCAACAETTEGSAGISQDSDILPNEDTMLGAMHFEAPEQYTSARRMTCYDVSGTVTEKRLIFMLEDAWWLTLRCNPLDDPSYDMKAEALQVFSEDAVTETEAGGRSALVCDDGDELYAFIQYDSYLYVVDYEEKAADTADRTFLDGFLSTLQFSGTWEDSPVNDDSLGTMGYTTPELTFRDKTITCRADQEGNLLDKSIIYSFESYWDRLFLEWYPGQTLSGYLSEEKLASAKELEIAGINACFVPYDEEKYGDSLGGYYIEQEDGLHEIYVMFDPVTEQREEVLARLLASVYFSDSPQITAGEVQEIIPEAEEEETEIQETPADTVEETAGAEETEDGTQEAAPEGTVTEQILSALDNDMYRQAYAAFADGLVIGNGYSGEAGAWLQTMLNTLGSNLEVDGAAGDMTFGELHFYQDILGMEQTDYVDAGVYEKLLPALLIATDVSKADETLRGAQLEGMLNYEDMRARVVSLVS